MQDNQNQGSNMNQGDRSKGGQNSQPNHPTSNNMSSNRDKDTYNKPGQAQGRMGQGTMNPNQQSNTR